MWKKAEISFLTERGSWGSFFGVIQSAEMGTDLHILFSKFQDISTWYKTKYNRPNLNE